MTSCNGGDVGGGSASKGGNANKGGTQGSGAGLGAGDGGKVGDQYAGVIKREIQRRFLKDPSFAGKVCSIKNPTRSRWYDFRLPTRFRI